MSSYRIEYIEQARQDKSSLARYIKDECKAPLTSVKYIEELQQKVESLRNQPCATSPDEQLSRRLGVPIRRLNYKKISVLYTVMEDRVIVFRIIPQSMLK